MTSQLSEKDTRELIKLIRATERTFDMLFTVSFGMPELATLAISTGKEHKRLLLRLRAHKRSKIHKDVNDEPCPICYDAMKAGDDVTFCWEKCGNNVHTACMHTVTCSLCRTKWDKDHLPPPRTCGAASVIQTAWRNYTKRQDAYMEVAREHMHASVIQTAWRNRHSD